MTCPICSGPLTTTALGADTPPLLCAGCHFAWWETEVTLEARAHFRRSMRDFGHQPAVRKATAFERERALILKGKR